MTGRLRVTADVSRGRFATGFPAPSRGTEWGRLNVPDPLPVVDGLMAATAKVRDWTFVTRDVGGLARTGVRLLNPFAASA